MFAPVTLNRASDRPLYRQLTELLGTRLHEEFTPGDRLPTEADLAAEYDVNRLTVRQALADLIRQGLVETVHGKGSFVSQPALRYEVAAGSEASLSRAMRAAGRDVQLRLLRSGTEDFAELRRALRTRRPAYRFDLLRLVDGTPWSLTTTWLSATRFPSLTEHWHGDTSLFDVLEQRYGLRTVRADRSFASVPATVLDSEHLLVPVGSPILAVRGMNVTHDGDPVAVVEHRFRGDRIQFTVDFR